MISNKDRETVLKAIRFEKPDYIPMKFYLNYSCWNAYPYDALWELIESHPLLFGGMRRPAQPHQPDYPVNAQKDHPYVDDWGCLWETTVDGVVGTVTKHPLDDWSKFDTYQAPDPRNRMGLGEMDWQKHAEWIAELKKLGCLTKTGLRHGHTFLAISDIRGYQNVLFDMEDEEPRLWQLLEMITDFNTYIIEQNVNLGVDLIVFAEDLGMQYGPMMSPDNFRKYILPCYKKALEPAKKKGTLIHMHSDGDLHTLMPALLECGIDVFNLQDLVNGIDWIRDNLKGKVCIDLDIDRQKIIPFGTEEEIDRLVLEEVKQLGSPQGGLMMMHELFPGVPLKNAKALMDAMEKYAFYYS